MRFPKHAQQLVITDGFRVELDEDDFGMASSITANLFVGWVLGLATGIAYCSCEYTRYSAVGSFRTPKSARAENGPLGCVPSWKLPTCFG